jgi:DNA-directed RNA polymerase specialized sigma24 family protein
MAQRIAVLTGDLVDSRKASDPQRLFQVLDTAIEAITARYDGQSERYRGDGFQIALPDPAVAMPAAVLLRAALIRHSEEHQRWDARIAVAIGRDAWQPGQRVTEASGEVFVRSGQTLDTMSEGTAHLALSLVEEPGSECLALLTRFVDDLVDGWSRYSAETVYLSLWHEESQQALAKRLGISQPSVHKRLRAARWALLDDYLRYLGQRFKDDPR